MSITPYNFQKPGPLATAQEEQFAEWLRQAAALATRVWQRQLPINLELAYRGSDALRAAQALQGLPEGMLGWRLALHNQLSTVTLWPRSLILAVVAVLLGDDAAELPAERELTVVEESLFEFFLKDLLFPKLQETWTGRVPLQPELGAKEPHPRWLRMFEPDESLVVTSMSLTGGFGTQEWRWLLPKKGLLASLDADGAAAENPAVVQRRLQELVRNMPVEIVVKLGTAELPLVQLAHLQVGDVVVLDQRINQPLRVMVGGQEKMRGWPGRQGTRQGLQIDHLES